MHCGTRGTAEICFTKMSKVNAGNANHCCINEQFNITKKTCQNNVTCNDKHFMFHFIHFVAIARYTGCILKCFHDQNVLVFYKPNVSIQKIARRGSNVK